MEIKFWGVRGSIPSPITTDQLKEKLILLAKNSLDVKTFDLNTLIKEIHQLSPAEFGSIGGNTSCVEIQINDKCIVLDMGSGLKNFGDLIFSQPKEKRQKEFHIFISHTHWDHISGFPFFKPANDPDTKIFIYSPIIDLKERLILQQNEKFFPVSFLSLKANIEIITLKIGIPFDLEGINIDSIALNHPGGSYGYKFKYDNKNICYMTDSSFCIKNNTQNESYYKNNYCTESEKTIEFLNKSEVLIIDAMYGTAEIESKKDYGHSTAQNAVDLGIIVNAKTIVLFHHDPDKNDIEINKIYTDTKKYFHKKHPQLNNEILLGYEGLILTA